MNPVESPPGPVMLGAGVELSNVQRFRVQELVEDRHAVVAVTRCCVCYCYRPRNRNGEVVFVNVLQGLAVAAAMIGSGAAVYLVLQQRQRGLDGISVWGPAFAAVMLILVAGINFVALLQD